MDFTALQKQILANVDKYSEQEAKVIIIKLLDFLVDINEKRNKLEEENRLLFEQTQAEQRVEINEQNQAKIQKIIEKANQEGRKVVETAATEAEKIISDAKNTAKGVLEDAKNESQAFFDSSLEKAKEIVNEIKRTDEEAKLYRSHILSIFRKAIFRFSDSNYYIIRSDDKDFQELLHFFEIDEKLQKLCDDNIEKLQKKVTYQEIKEQVNNHPEIEEIVEIKNIINDKEKIDDTIIKDIKEMNIPDITAEQTQEIKVEAEKEKNEELNSKKFLEIIGKYKK